MKGEIELYNISFLILKVELHFKLSTWLYQGAFPLAVLSNALQKTTYFSRNSFFQKISEGELLIRI